MAKPHDYTTGRAWVFGKVLESVRVLVTTFAQWRIFHHLDLRGVTMVGIVRTLPMTQTLTTCTNPRADGVVMGSTLHATASGLLHGVTAMGNHVEVKQPAPTPGFTPGPWHVEDVTEVVAKGKDGLLTVCRAHETDIYADGSGGTAEANARLIAAAPDGYHAVIGLLNAIHDSMTHESQRFHADAIDAARAYLAKAGGK